MEFVNTTIVLNEMGAEIVQKAQLELGVQRPRTGRRTSWKKTGSRGWQPKRSQVVRRKGRINASGALSRSLDYQVDVTPSGDISVAITGLDYGDVINEGRGPTKRGGSGAVFKNIKQWARIKPVRVRKITKQGGSQFAKATPEARNAQAFLISRSIHHFGFPATHFMDNAVDRVVPNYSQKIKDALIEDFKNDL